MGQPERPGNDVQIGALLHDELDDFPEQVAKLAIDLVSRASRGVSESTLCETFLSDLKASSKGNCEVSNGSE